MIDLIIFPSHYYSSYKGRYFSPIYRRQNYKNKNYFNKVKKKGNKKPTTDYADYSDFIFKSHLICAILWLFFNGLPSTKIGSTLDKKWVDPRRKNSRPKMNCQYSLGKRTKASPESDKEIFRNLLRLFENCRALIF